MSDLGNYQPRTFEEYRLAMKYWLIGNNSRITNFNAGSRIQTIFDAVAFLLARSDVELTSGFRNMITNSMYEMFNITRLPPVSSTGILRLEVVDSQAQLPLSMPVFRIKVGSLTFTTRSIAIIDRGSKFTEVIAVCEQAGIDGNIKPEVIDTDSGTGTLLDGVELPTGIRIYNPTEFINGKEIESPENRHLRFQQYIQSLNKSTLIGIKTAVMSVPGVILCYAEDNFNPYTRERENGWINVYISDGSENPSQTLKDYILKLLKGDVNDSERFPGIIAAGSEVFVGDIHIVKTNFEVSVEILTSSKLSATSVASYVMDATNKYVNALPNGYDVIIETLKSRILLSHPDFYKITIHSPIEDIKINPDSLARFGGKYGGRLTIREIKKVTHA